MSISLEKTREIKVLISQVRSLCETIQDVLNNASSNEVARYISYRAMAQLHNNFVTKAKELLSIETMLYTIKMDKVPRASELGWPEQKQVMEQVLISAKLLLASLEGNLDFANDEYDNLANFLQSRLRSAMYQKPEKEIEVQNAIECLFLGRGYAKGIEYDRESGKFDFSGKEYIPDFIIPKLSLCIEVKLLREGRRSRIIEEISADITAYKKKYPRQLYVVYDLGVIQNETQFRRDIEMIDGVKVIIVKH